MRAVIQRVTEAQVSVDGRTVGAIGTGLLVYVGVAATDEAADAQKLAEKVVNLRIFEDDADKLNRSVLDIDGAVLAVPNFTLLADARKGRRPAFVAAAGRERAQELFEHGVAAMRDNGCQVATGVFGARMLIDSQAAGPVNILYDTVADG